MLRDSYEKDPFFMKIIRLTTQKEPILAQIDQVLEDEEIFQLIKCDLSKRHPLTKVTGRNSTPVEVILRMLVVRRLYNFSYEKTEYHVRDSLELRQFCRVYFNDVPDDTTLIKWANLIQPQTLEQLNLRVTELAKAIKVTRGRKLRTDGTVVESNIHPPSDSSLLADSVRVIGRTLSRAKEALADSTDLAQKVFRNRVRSAKRTAHQVGEAMSKRSAAARARGIKSYQKLVKITQESVAQARQVLAALQEAASAQAQQLADILENFIPQAEKVIDQTVRRVFEGEKVPASEKIVSIFEPHTDIICRSKGDTRYGHKVWLDEVDGGIISNYRVLDGNPNDKTQWQPSLERHVEIFGKPPDQSSADRGVHSQSNEEFAKDLGVKRVVLPKSGYKSKAQREHEKQAWFKRGRRWHNGVEGRISVLKRGHGLDRCLDHGSPGFERWVGWGVIGGNLAVIGRTVAARSR
jgi:transposase, IS5 family